MNRVTASKTGLLVECKWWARAEAEWSDTTSSASDFGTRFHRAIAHYVTTGEFNLAATDDDILPLCNVAQAWLDYFEFDQVKAEIAFVWHPETDTAERIHAKDRDYSSYPDALCGTADLVIVDRLKNAGYIGDWKTGDGSRSGPQLRTLALMLSRAEHLDTVTVEAIEVSAEGLRIVCREVLDAFALSAVAGELVALLAEVPTSVPVPGPHCGERWCPARATCPAVRERLADILPAEVLVRHKWGLTIENADHAAWLYQQAKVVEAAAKLVKECVRAYVPAEGLQLSDGSLLIEGTRNMPRTDHDRVASLARSMGATEEQLEACRYVAVESSGLKVKKSKRPKEMS